MALFLDVQTSKYFDKDRPQIFEWVSFLDVWTSKYLPRIGLEYSNITLAPDSEPYLQAVDVMNTLCLWIMVHEIDCITAIKTHDFKPYLVLSGI